MAAELDKMAAGKAALTINVQGRSLSWVHRRKNGGFSLFQEIGTANASTRPSNWHR